MNKKLFSFLVSLCMCLSILPAAAFAAADGNTANSAADISDSAKTTTITYTDGLLGSENGIITNIPLPETVTWKKDNNLFVLPVSTQIPVRNGFIFGGWAIDSGSRDGVYNADNNTISSQTPPGQNLVLRAVWNSPTGKTTSIYYSTGQGGTLPNDPYQERVPAETAYTLRTPQELGLTATRDDVVFLGWIDKNAPGYVSKILTANDTAPTLLTTVTVKEGEDKLISALFGYDQNGNGIADLNDEKVTVSFDMNSTVFANSIPAAPIKSVVNGKIVISDPPRRQADQAGIIGVGWSLQPVDKVLTKTDSMPELVGRELTVTEDITLYAVWGEDSNRDSYADIQQVATVTYEAPGAQNVPAPQQVLCKQALVGAGFSPTYPLSETVPTMEGKVFAGWQLKGSDIYAEPGETFIAADQLGYPDITLVALWDSLDEVSYTLSFDGNGSTGGTLPAALTKTGYTDTFNFTVPAEGDMTKAGHLFICWCTKADDTGDYYWPGETITVNKNTDVKLYAIWDTAPVMHFNMPEADAGTVPADVYAHYDNQYNLFFTLPEKSPARTGYNFLGYKIKQVFNGAEPRSLTAEPEYLDETKLYQPGAKIYCDDAQEYLVTAVWEKSAVPTPTPKPDPQPVTPVPAPAVRPASPQTGDSSNLALWTLLAVLCASGASVLIAKRKHDRS